MENSQNLSSSDWQWQKWNGLPYLTCNILKFWHHGFFTASFYPFSPDKLVEALDTTAQVYRVKQVHGHQIFSTSEIDPEYSHQSDSIYPEADALISDQTQDMSHQSLWVASADCTPLLIGDQKTGQVSAIHAGWRGTSQRIVPYTIQHFLKKGSQTKNLRVAMGPAITGSVYQVTEEVAIKVVSSLLENPEKWTQQDILDKFSQCPNSSLLPDSEDGKIRLDVRRVNQLQLEQMGIQADQIAIAPHCTYQMPNLFFSYRRTHKKQIQWSGIVSQARV